MLRILAGLAALMAVTAGTAVAGSYNYVKPETVKQWLEKKKPVTVVDIQVPAEFAKQHLPGSIETNAYPVKSDEDRKRLEKALGPVASSTEEVVIVCPRGGGGAKNAYDHLASKGVDAKRLFILEKGIEGWPYPEMVVPK